MGDELSRLRVNKNSTALMVPSKPFSFGPRVKKIQESNFLVNCPIKKSIMLCYEKAPDFLVWFSMLPSSG